MAPGHDKAPEHRGKDNDIPDSDKHASRPVMRKRKPGSFGHGFASLFTSGGCHVSTHDKKLDTLTVGNYPGIGVAEARQRREEIRADIANGNDAKRALPRRQQARRHATHDLTGPRQCGRTTQGAHGP
ncbi:Arm DNA-binding domain-containing protein [Pseudogulbenkiania subflava]|uniref:Arm DNA-binding domain-containing protein n=1 Tax=Pseudogulbenkiania subflava TaxID=451637 RepID=UPI00389AE2F6